MLVREYFNVIIVLFVVVVVTPVMFHSTIKIRWLPAEQRGNIISSPYVCPSVCMYVCMYVCHMIALESLDAESSFLFLWYIFTGYGSCSYMKVIGSRSRSQEHKTWNVISPPLCSNDSITTTATTVSAFTQWGVSCKRNSGKFYASYLCGIIQRRDMCHMNIQQFTVCN